MQIVQAKWISNKKKPSIIYTKNFEWVLINNGTSYEARPYFCVATYEGII